MSFRVSYDVKLSYYTTILYQKPKNISMNVMLIYFLTSATCTTYVQSVPNKTTEHLIKGYLSVDVYGISSIG